MQKKTVLLQFLACNMHTPVPQAQSHDLDENSADNFH
jgi:hypothetical protein